MCACEREREGGREREREERRRERERGEREGERERERDRGRERESSYCLLLGRYPKQMDEALQTALQSMAANSMEPSGSVKEEEGEGEGEGEVRWIHEFVAMALPGSRHQVGIDTVHVNVCYNVHVYIYYTCTYTCTLYIVYYM